MEKLNFGKLFTEGVLIDVNISKWEGKVRLDKEDLGLDEAPEFYSLGRKRLIPKGLVGKFNSIDTRTRLCVSEHGFQFPIGKHYFIPKKNLPDLLSKLEELKSEFYQCVEEFIDEYREIQEEMIKEYMEWEKKSGISIVDKIRSLYPIAKRIRTKFSFDWILFAISNNDGVFVTDNEALEAQAENEKLAEIYREKSKILIDEFIDDIVAELRLQTTELCDMLKKKLDNNELISNKNISTMENFIEYFKSLNFVGDETVEKQLEELKGHLKNVDSYDYKKNEGTRSELAEILSRIREKAETVSDISKITGQFKRKIEFD